MRLQDLRDELLSLRHPVFHYFAHQQPDQYIVWAEDGQGQAGHGDNSMTTQTIQGTIDYFTKTEFDSTFNQIQEKLNTLDLAWRLNSVQYEEDTKYIHYEWVFEFVNEDVVQGG